MILRTENTFDERFLPVKNQDSLSFESKKKAAFDRVTFSALQMWPFSSGLSENQINNSLPVALGIKGKIKINFSYS
jgi:hypothetical protein